MNTLSKLYFLVIAFFFFSCLSTGDTQKFTDKKLSLNQDLIITIKSVRANLQSVNINGKRFAARSIIFDFDNEKMTSGSGEITELKISINNSSDIDYDYSELEALDMVFINSIGKFKFIQYSPKTNFDMKSPQKKFHKNRKINETLYFIHNPEDVPIAITVNRLDHVLFTDETNPKYNNIMLFLKKHSNIERMLTLAQSSTFEAIDIFRKENDIEIDASNRQGLNLLYIGILSGNDSIVLGAINNGCDLYKKISYSHYGLIEPIHAAFLANNRNAIEALLNAGVEINQLGAGNNSPAVIAVRSNNVEALKLLTEFGVDLTRLMIPMNMSPAIPALKFAKDRKRNEMVQYLESLEIK